MKAKTQGAHHIGLSVPDVKAAANFFVEALGFDLVGEKPDYPAAFVSDGTILITLWRVADLERAKPFDRHINIGLHHLALHVVSSDDLEKLSTELASRDDVAIEFKPEPLTGSTYRHMMCAIPGNIRLELIAG
ncbi:VOC family protein [Desulfopila sp. IMCC35006]|uniref:VOC family protein n=1 Tax=Desulfopila sp. IMCC35006 TaxID=2569542 RepID=UPI0010ABEC09|nr:VOC family protein [Desulfopila sp. IMCC35006]TKB25582.1 VOC family protein [Desulfopila sp. IMCC35006]